MYLEDIFFLKRNKITSNGSRFSFFFKNNLPIFLKKKKLFFFKKYNSGRNKSGKIVIRTKGKKNFRILKIFNNLFFRYLNLVFITNFIFVSFRKKIFSLIYLSSGLITYLQATTNYKLFEVAKFISIFFLNKQKIKIILTSKPYIKLNQIIFLIKQLPKNQNISLLEKIPGEGIKYVMSSGSTAKINKMDTRINNSLIKLPSGVLKIFSIYSIGSLGNIGLVLKNKQKINKAGFFKKNGKKSLSRGIVKNPTDHPHGGRTKAIKYPRTPWGKTTKYK